ncbi:hypothetical protein [Pedobacter metabolipauper]|uniref:DinB family protein n=1 Tax=Pedobacter metabolipauper TaxID=425513 RepID=A0A4V3D0Y0_9SPHI|nr:hypothetical protein [Pedobacter metabolipauper]TDQ08234.1 hypothetical protein ATK78_2742 [Pedobacter metabolipauper]
METTINPLLELLEELYIGSNDAPTWVIDRKPGYGFTAAVKTLTSEQASTPLVDGGSTVAAHTEHLRWSIYYALEFFKGQMPSWDWKESWNIREVNDNQWEKLQNDLLVGYHLLKQAIAGTKDWSNPHLLKGTIALLPHAAYHLGAIKQLIIAVKDKG